MLKIQSCVYLLIDKFPMNPKLPKEVAWLLCHMLQTWEPMSYKGRLFTHIWNSSEADIVITIFVHIKKNGVEEFRHYLPSVGTGLLQDQILTHCVYPILLSITVIHIFLEHKNVKSVKFPKMFSQI